MRKSRSVSNFMFRAVCLSFSVLLLVLSLLYRVKLMSMEKNISELEKSIELREIEAQILKVRLENRISLSELEAYATQELGMHRPTAEQVIFIYDQYFPN